jgi:hypothetical protein
MEKVYYSVLKENIEVQHKLLGLLEQKVEATREEIKNPKLAKLTAIDLEISVIRTNAEIDTLKKVLQEKENYFQKYAEKFEKDVAEMNLNYAKVVKRAEFEASKKPQLSEFLSKSKNVDLEGNIEAKLYFYNRVKAFL